MRANFQDPLFGSYEGRRATATRRAPPQATEITAKHSEKRHGSTLLCCGGLKNYQYSGPMSLILLWYHVLYIYLRILFLHAKAFVSFLTTCLGYPAWQYGHGAPRPELGSHEKWYGKSFQVFSVNGTKTDASQRCPFAGRAWRRLCTLPREYRVTLCTTKL